MIRSIVFGFLLFSSSAWADTFRVHYSIRGSGRDVTVQAESSGEARRTVMDMFPGAVVTGVQPRQAINLPLSCPRAELLGAIEKGQAKRRKHACLYCRY